MTYSYTQISNYLGCPRRYRYRYIDGWKEKDTRASMLFGRAFEKALAAHFLRQDSAKTLYEEWGAYKENPLDYSNGDSWERMAQQGVELLELLAKERRVRIRQPRRNLQVKATLQLSNNHEFIAYFDAIGTLDGTRGLLEWKTTTSRYPVEPEGLLNLDPQLVCYSWISGITEVALIAFLRKRNPEIQYLRTSITEKQREEFRRLVEECISQMEAGHFLPHSGIRFPQNGCLSCPYLGLCLGRQELADSRLIRQPGASDLDWLDRFDL